MKSYILVLCIAFFALPLCAQKQGIKGKVVWVSGNQMPGPDKKKSDHPGIQREVYIYEPTSMDQVTSVDATFFQDIKTKLIAKVKSKKDGTFCIKLPPGSYSVFVKEPKGLFANLFDSNNKIHVVSIKEKEFLDLTIQVNYEAAY